MNSRLTLASICLNLQREGKTRQELLESIRTWYNGYSWDGQTRIYNPFSLLNLFSSMRFSNYWFATGTPTFLIKLIKETGTEITEFENKQIAEIVLDSYDLDHMNLFALLFQTGYLTVTGISREEEFTQYTLNYPNLEVKNSLLTFIMEGDIPKPGNVNLIDPLPDHNSLDTASAQVFSLGGPLKIAETVFLF